MYETLRNMKMSEKKWMERNCTESPNDISLKRIDSFTAEINIRYI